MAVAVPTEISLLERLRQDRLNGELDNPILESVLDGLEEEERLKKEN